MFRSFDPVGTTDAATERTLTYTANSMLATLKDAENNLTTYEYDGHDRLAKTRYPVPTKGANASSTTDFEQPTYDANSNVTAFRNRANQSIAFTYDNLDRVTLKNLPGTEPDVTYGYDNLGRLTSATQTGNALTFTYDALSRNLTQTGPHGTASFAWDAAGRRTSIAYPAGGTALTISYTYLVTNDLSAIKQGTTDLAAYAHDDLGRRTSVTFDNGVVQAFTFDPVSRLASLTNQLDGNAEDLTKTFAHNPALQITTETKSNDAYAVGKSAVAESGTANGLNQLTQYAAQALSHDTKGNVTAFGTDSFAYSAENLLTSATVGGTATTLAYDPLLRLYQTVAGATTSRFAYDGLDALAEYNGSNALQRRWVFDPSGITGQPIVWYEGSETGNNARRYLSADERGSVISVSDNGGDSLGLNRYDEFGNPAASNLGRYGYTGQAWIPSAQLWYYKARVYSPVLGRFLQTDPIGYASGVNLYAYVGNDPVNLVDPLGLDETITKIPCEQTAAGCPTDIIVTRVRIPQPNLDLVGSITGTVNILQFLRDLEQQIKGIAKQLAKADRQRLSQCLVTFLNKFDPSADWSKVQFIKGGNIPGMGATTFGYNVMVNPSRWPPSTGLILHELGHIPQWSSGALTYRSYTGQLIGALLTAPTLSDVHDAIPFESEAIAYAEALAAALDEANACG